jgi:hypothetical protein
VLAAVAGAAVWAGWRTRNRRLAGFGEFEVDLMRRSITLPMKKDQVARDVVSAERVEEIEIREVVTKSDDSTTTKYIPTVRWRERSGEMASRDLGEFYDRAEAEALRDWLARQLKLKLSTTSADSGAGRTGPVGT